MSYFSTISLLSASTTMMTSFVGLPGGSAFSAAAPVWTPAAIEKATETWFAYLGEPEGQAQR